MPASLKKKTITIVYEAFHFQSNDSQNLVVIMLEIFYSKKMLPISLRKKNSSNTNQEHKDSKPLLQLFVMFSTLKNKRPRTSVINTVLYLSTRFLAL